jgi:hypothetical protein
MPWEGGGQLPDEPAPTWRSSPAWLRSAPWEVAIRVLAQATRLGDLVCTHHHCNRAWSSRPLRCISHLHTATISRVAEPALAPRARHCDALAYFLTTWNFTVLSVNRPHRMAVPSSTANMGISTTCANTMSQLIPWV